MTQPVAPMGNNRIGMVMTTNDSERMAFEDAFIKIRPGASFTRHAKYPSVYLWEHVEEAWSTWQARGEYERLRTPPAEAQQDGVVQVCPDCDIADCHHIRARRASVRVQEVSTQWRDGHGDIVKHSDLYDQCPICAEKEEDLDILRERLKALEPMEDGKYYLKGLTKVQFDTALRAVSSLPTTDEAAHADMLVEKMEAEMKPYDCDKWVWFNAGLHAACVIVRTHDKRRANKEQGS